MSDLQKQVLARQIAARMRRDPDEMVALPGGEVQPLWRVILKAMDSVPAPVRALLEAQGRHKRRTLGQILGAWKRRMQRRDGWTDPRDSLPPAVDGALSEVVLVKRVDRTEPAVLLYGTPIGSHRWILNKDRPDEHYIHVLDIDGWQEMSK